MTSAPCHCRSLWQAVVARFAVVVCTKPSSLPAVWTLIWANWLTSLAAWGMGQVLSLGSSTKLPIQTTNDYLMSRVFGEWGLIRNVALPRRIRTAMRFIQHLVRNVLRHPLSSAGI